MIEAMRAKILKMVEMDQSVQSVKEGRVQTMQAEKGKARYQMGEVREMSRR